MKKFTLLFTIILSLLFINSPVLAITNGMLASDVIGQYDGTSYTDPVGIFTKGGLNDGPNMFGLNAPYQTAIDTVHHRFFIAEYSNNRVLVYNLNEDNTFPDKFPDYVLGQPNFYTNTASITQSGMYRPIDIVYDSNNNRLFVAEWQNNRILVYDVNEITNGELAINVLGQPDFATNAENVADATSTRSPFALVYDDLNGMLFVAQSQFNRVTIFDVNEILNNEPAINVLGQANFTTSSANQSQSGMNSPRGIVFDSVNKYLFVAQNNGRRITIYDVNEIVDGENAINVLGQANFTANVSTISQIGGDSFGGLDYDSTNGRLFAAGNNRLLIYNIADGIINGENAINVLGQTLFSTSTASTTQNGLSGPQGVLYDSTNNKIIVADMNNQRLMIFDTTTIDNGENAVDLLGQYDGTSYTNPAPIYTKSGANNGPNIFGLNGPYDVAIDSTNHRLFITDGTNNRVLVYNLNYNNILSDHIPDYVLGQPDFLSSAAVTTQSGLNNPTGIAYDSNHNRLFVSNYSSSRVIVYDVTEITNGEPAINVLGQPDFINTIVGPIQSSMNAPRGLVYDNESNKLFVADQINCRVLIFDANEIVNGENAINVLGQSNFTTATVNNSQSGVNWPQGLAYDSVNKRLFVAQSNTHRVSVFDVNEIIDGENAINVLGQPDYISVTPLVTQSIMNSPCGLSFDNENQILFVSERGNNRVTIFDVNEIIDGENAINVLGQSDFTSNTSRTTQSGVASLRGVAYDSISNSLYLVVSTDGMRIMVFNLSNTTITSVSAPSGTYQRGDTIPISVTFSKVVNVTGTPTLTLETGDTDQIASYDSGSGTDTLIFNYEVQREDEAESLDYTSIDVLSLNDGTILDLYNGLPIFTLPIPGETGSLSNTSDVRVVIPRRSSGSYIQLTNLPQQPITPTVPEVPVVDNTITPATPSSELITKIEKIKTVLRPNTISDDIKLIQIYLNTHGYPIALSGPGSQGYETNKYGKLTRQAVIKFQLANNLSPDGVVGPMTRGKMK